MQQWEYKIESRSALNFIELEFTESWLNEMGQSGWQLCATEVIHSNLAFYTFKRVKL